jgi:hypothetical protein
MSTTPLLWLLAITPAFAAAEPGGLRRRDVEGT